MRKVSNGMDKQEPAIVVKNLTKEFIIPHKKHGSLKSLFVDFGRKGKADKRKVLDDISFQINKGEFFGIVGRNGSGKSTLLKLLAGVYTPTKGEIGINGSLTPFIELGVGFNPELTGRENVFLNGALLGFTHKQMQSMYKNIVDFAELNDFMDTKLKNYSSGMQVRLAFSVAIRAESDILLIDEVLAVGDAAFQQKCFEYFEEIKRNNNKSVVFVSHDMNSVRQFCDRALYLERGKILKIGDTEEVSGLYEVKNFEDASPELKDEIEQDVKVWLCNAENESKNSFKAGEQLAVNIQWDNILHEVNIAGVTILKAGQVVFATNSIGQKSYENNRKAQLQLKQLLGNGRYTITVGLFGKSRNDMVSMLPEIITFNIYGNKLKGCNNDEWNGVTYIKNKWL